MNTKNNNRRRASQNKIEETFVALLQTREIDEITVSDIIKITELNRSTFYSNYTDIYDLADKIKGQLEQKFREMFVGYKNIDEHTGLLFLFTHIKEHQTFYNTYFKVCYEDTYVHYIYDIERAKRHGFTKNIDYHINFFKSGLKTIIKMWLANECKESPEEMAQVIMYEYKLKD